MNPIKNAWYAVALSSSITGKPIKRGMLGHPLVAYRGESGQATVLSDICPHRFAPLHQGKVKGDCIECPYHGLQFDTTGACCVNPHGDGRIPRGAKVRAYPTLERNGVVWAWTGEPDLADPDAALDLSAYFESRPLAVRLELVINAHYEMVIDNLMDLSHGPFLHPTTLADPDSISNLRMEVQEDEGTVWSRHYMPQTKPMPQFAAYRKSTEPLCDAHAHIQWLAPSNLLLDVGITDVGRPDSEGVYNKSAHLLTPIDMHSTHYIWLNVRNFAVDDDRVTQLMRERGGKAFTTEDGPMIEAAAMYMGTPDLLSLSPVWLPSDAGGVRVRRLLQQLRDKEAQAANVRT